MENKQEESDSEEQARGADSRSAASSQPQRVALFPGMDPSALKVCTSRVIQFSLMQGLITLDQEGRWTLINLKNN